VAGFVTWLASAQRRATERTEAARADAEAARQRLALLAQASRRLASSLDYEATLAEVARLAVPTFADACIVDLLAEDGSIVRVAEAHADPSREGLLRELRRYLPESRAAHPVLQVIRSGAPSLRADFTDAERAAIAEDEEHLRLHRDLAFNSYLVVPLVLQGRMLGALSFFTAASGRRFSQQDEPLAEELARRAARAVENSRLHQQLRNLLGARQAFVAAVTHDLRGPLTAIKAYTQVLQRQLARHQALDPARTRDVLTSLSSQIEKLTALIQELSDTQQLETGELLALNPEPTELVALVQRCVAAKQLEVGPNRLRLEPSEQELEGTWDGLRLERVLDNLLENACKYSPQESTILVSIGRDADKAVLQVRDHGMGIPAADLPHVFDRYRRGSNVQGRVAGTGLGLWGVRQIIEQHGGTIHIETQEGAGTTVIVRLPLDTTA
jgi:signal transduction histidine kinase